MTPNANEEPWTIFCCPVEECGYTYALPSREAADSDECDGRAWGPPDGHMWTSDMGHPPHAMERIEAWPAPIFEAEKAERQKLDEILSEIHQTLAVIVSETPKRTVEAIRELAHRRQEEWSRAEQLETLNQQQIKKCRELEQQRWEEQRRAEWAEARAEAAERALRERG